MLKEQYAIKLFAKLDNLVKPVATNIMNFHQG